MNGLGIPKRTGMAQAISEFTTTKCVRIGTLSGTGSDYTVQTISCIRFWPSSKHASKETWIDMLEIYSSKRFRRNDHQCTVFALSMSCLTSLKMLCIYSYPEESGFFPPLASDNAVSHGV